ncbi:Ent-kaurene oxidase [Podospora australis]|uniref:Ent-kaurene oxidase n=1 Tax=Podospora australis TaxID=1536484 RepID=A0AAN7AGP1_9PEZI|nr:Ent-kaurene oxidase [Podospora australis]
MASQPLQVFAAVAALAAIYLLARRFFLERPDDWKTGKPVVGLRNQWFPWAQATLRSFSLSKQWSFEGYQTFGKVNSPFIIPCVERGPVVIIPPKQIKKVYGLHDEVLDMQNTANDSIQTKYTIADKEIYRQPFQMNVIRNQMTRNLDVLTPVMATEFEAAFERMWDTPNNDWKELNLWTDCLNLISSVSNAAFCGAPLCRNEAFLKSLQDHGMITFMGALMISATPSFLKPVTGTLIGWACEFQFQRAKRLCLPYIKERLANTARARADPTFCWETPRDGLQWLIQDSYATNDPSQLDPVRVTRRFLYINDISLHSTSYTMQNVIPDIYNPAHQGCGGGGGDGEKSLLEALRQEASTVLGEAGGVWTRDAVQKLRLADASIRESMRMSPFASIALPRTVLDPHGLSLDTPDGKGVFNVPRGTVIATPIDAVHRDPSIYLDDDPDKFNPFRDGGKLKSAVTLDDSFLGFGFGRHACPGRFFALHEMKIMVAHMVLNYDVEVVGGARPPELTNMVWLKVPYHQGRVRVRRRQK